MTALLDARTVESVLGMRDAIDLLEQTLAHQAAGATFASPKFVSEFDGGNQPRQSAHGARSRMWNM